MGNTEDGFGKKRDHNQYGDTLKDNEKDKKDVDRELPKKPNDGERKKDKKTP